ncbi:S41 family peptidase [Vibrio penaeicida]|uniref:Tail specific protease domain-containing protein n=1 Tax=Vibrio penaeicida TaxID=104609 RepID=A0AAV5P1C6_9VIBR|nr:S41 family peptidase [Vibrio penaeicida]RTZ23117.1 hypothetical protein EKN09_10655 [Vibrio penaeicida]GLQ76253.1 hypothetical protein GCM10007932_56160 [Vibrio penaeicida]
MNITSSLIRKTIILIFFIFPSITYGKYEDISLEEKIYGLSLIWSNAKEHFVFLDTDVASKLDESYIEYISKVADMDGIHDYYKALSRFSALLNDGHTKVFPPLQHFRENIDWPDVYLNEIEGEILVTSVGQSYIGAIPLGSTVLEVEEIPVRDYLAMEVFPYSHGSSYRDRWNLSVSNAFMGLAGSTVNITYRRPSGELGKAELTRNSKSYDDTIDHVDIFKPKRKSVEFSMLSDDIAYVSINNLRSDDVFTSFMSVFEDITKAKGLIIDLRANGGGDTSVVNKIIPYLINQEVQSSSWKTRISNSYNEARKGRTSEHWFNGNGKTLTPHGKAINIPTHVLIGRNTGSAALDFLVYLNKLERFTKYGETTNSSTGQPMSFDLPGGGKGIICVKHDFFPSGEEFVGIGIKPDVTVELKKARILKGYDDVLQIALYDLKSKLEAR